MKLEGVIKDLLAQQDAKVKRVNQLAEALEIAKVELQQINGAYQLASQLKAEEDKEAKELKLKQQVPVQEVNKADNPSTEVTAE